MPIVRDSIDRIRCCVLPDGISADGSAAALSRAILVTWRSTLAGKLHQAYVNGRLAGMTVAPEQRQLVVQLPSSFSAAVRLEIVGVDPEEGQVDFSAELDDRRDDSARIHLTLLRSQDIPLGSGVNVYFDNGAGQIDYGTPLNPTPIPVWPYPQDKAGFGMAEFGTGDFGYESGAAIGHGRGCFGLGQFGLDADAIEWISPELPLGIYRLGATVIDHGGSESAPTETSPITVTPAAQPAATLDVASFDAASNQLIFNMGNQT